MDPSLETVILLRYIVFTLIGIGFILLFYVSVKTSETDKK